jgi:hypothetical protein
MRPLGLRKKMEEQAQKVYLTSTNCFFTIKRK